MSESEADTVLGAAALLDLEPSAKLAQFDGVVPLDQVFLRRFLDVGGEVMFPSFKGTDPTEPSFVQFMGDINPKIVFTDEKDVSKLHLVRYRKVAPSDVRGRTRLVTPIMVEANFAVVDLEGMQQHIAEPNVFGISGKRWIALDQTWPKSENHRFQACASLLFVTNLLWSVYLKVENGLGLTFPTDYAGAREAFRLRDAAPGKARRTAIRHWVSEHNRVVWQTKATANVKRHLRGTEEFQWKGLTCRIKPSYFEIKDPSPEWAGVVDKLKERMGGWARKHGERS